MAGDDKVAAACKNLYPTWKNDCSGFVRAVAKELGVSLSGNADAIVGAMEKGWTKTDRASCLTHVRAGHLVIAGLASKEHTKPRSNGHVVVVVDGALYRGIFPRCWSGSIAGAVGQSDGTRSVGEVWNTKDRELVKYYYK